MTLPAGSVVSDQHVVGPLKQALPSARNCRGLRYCGVGIQKGRRWTAGAVGWS